MKQPSIISILTFLYFITSSIMATNWELLETNYAKVYYPATHKQLAIETAYYLEKHRKKVQTYYKKQTISESNSAATTTTPLRPLQHPEVISTIESYLPTGFTLDII